MRKLNPWKIEVDYIGSESIRLDAVSMETGEIKQITLFVDDINAIELLGTKRIYAIAEYFDEFCEHDNNALDTLISFSGSN